MLIKELNFSSIIVEVTKEEKKEYKCICKDCWKLDAYTKLSILSLI